MNGDHGVVVVMKLLSWRWCGNEMVIMVLVRSDHGIIAVMKNNEGLHRKSKSLSYLTWFGKVQ